ncbi:MAG: hypothetical protein ACYTG5_19255 [Planctomycetota bacterium]|jgi:hypothetical protein
MRPHPSPGLFSLCSLVLFALLASCRGDSGSSAGEGAIGPAGGVVTVTTGPLTGTILSVPPGALFKPIYIEVNQASEPEVDGFENIGPGTNFSPTGLSLDELAAATLVFEPARLPVIESPGEVMVIRQSSQGRRTFLTPRSVDMDAGVVVVDIDSLSTYWVAVQTQSVGFILSNYLPLLDGDSYVYDNGFALLVENSFSEPNLEGLLVSALSFVRDGGGFGYYLSREFAKTFYLGGFDVLGAFQEVVLFPLLFLDATGFVGEAFADTGLLAVFEPLAAPIPSGEVEVRTLVRIESSGSLPTVLGRFSDVLEVSVRVEREDSFGNVSETLDVFWLARGVGPVQISLDGVVDGIGSLVAGVVDGLPIIPR